MSSSYNSPNPYMITLIVIAVIILILVVIILSYVVADYQDTQHIRCNINKINSRLKWLNPNDFNNSASTSASTSASAVTSDSDSASNQGSVLPNCNLSHYTFLDKSLPRKSVENKDSKKSKCESRKLASNNYSKFSGQEDKCLTPAEFNYASYNQTMHKIAQVAIRNPPKDLYDRFIAGHNITEAVNTYNDTFKHSKMQIGICNKAESVQNVLDNHILCLDVVNKGYDIYILHCASGMGFLPLNDIIAFYKKLIDAAIISGSKISLDEPPNKYYNENILLKNSICPYCVEQGFNNFVITFQAYRQDYEAQLTNFIATYDNFFPISLVCGGYVQFESKEIITDNRAQIILNYINMAKILQTHNVNAMYATQNTCIRDMLINNNLVKEGDNFNMIYGVNNKLDDLYKDYNQYVVMGIGGFEKTRIPVLIVSNYFSVSPELNEP